MLSDAVDINEVPAGPKRLVRQGRKSDPETRSRLVLLDTVDINEVLARPKRLVRQGRKSDLETRYRLTRETDASS